MKLFKLGFCLVLLVAVSLPAVGQESMRVNIPFHFDAAGKSLPAGHYRIARVFESDQAVWSISNRHDATIIRTNSVQSRHTAHRPALIFLKSGDQYTLVQFWSDEYSGQELVLKTKVKSTMLANRGTYIEIKGE